MGLWESAVRQRAEVFDAFRTRLWPVPTAGVVLAILAGVGFPSVDAALQDLLPAQVASWLFGGGPGAAREVLGAVAASLITVTSLTFSLTVVTLQLASGQYSPRLLRTFARDRFVQFTLALFLSTFVYALTVLRTVRDPTPGVAMFVPKFSVTVAYVLALISVIGLVLFLAHLVRQIRLETIVRTVYVGAQATAHHVFPERDPDDSPEPPTPPPWALAVYARSSGFFVSSNIESMLSSAVEADAVVWVDRMPGDWLVEGTPVAFAWPAEAGAELGEESRATLGDRVAAAVRTGDERTPSQDGGYGLRQLTDVAVKALSPGINDPTTAIHTLGYTSALLCEIGQRRLGPSVHHDEDGVVRVVVRHPDLADLLDLAISQPRRYGASDPAVLSKLFWLLRELAWRISTADARSAIRDQLARLRSTVSEQGFDKREREGLQQLGRAVEAALADDWHAIG